MHKNIFFRIFLLVCLLTLVAGLLVVAQNRADHVRVYVEFERFSPQAVALVRAAGGDVHHEFPRFNAVAVTLPSAAIHGLLRNPNVVAIEEDPIRVPYAETTPYGIGLVQADQVSDANAGNRKVCIIDSGIDASHEDLDENQLNGANDSGTGDWFKDGCGHGTHVAGTIAALDNSVGVIGVLPSGNINLHIVKVFGDSCSWTYSSSLIAALDECTAVGSNVVSMSLGGTFKSRFEDRAFRDAYKADVLSVAAAGNAGNTRKSYPASYDSVISVAAIDSSKMVAPFSQQNDQVELAAPGVAVRSTVPMGTGAEESLTVDSVTYEAVGMEGSPNATGTGPLVDCGLGTTACPGGGGQVCLIQRGGITFAEKVQNCEAGSGVGAVIYNNADALFAGTLGGAVTSIPSVGISGVDGQFLMDNNKLGTSATVTTGPGNYAFFDGTSMATPHVSGVSALVWSNHTSCTNDEVRLALQATAEDLPPGANDGRDNAYGYGLIQAWAANEQLALNGCGGGSSGGGGQCTGPGEGQPGDFCSDNGECCSNKCTGKPGAKTCK